MQSSATFPQRRAQSKKIQVYDRRSNDNQTPGKWFETSGLDFNDFLQLLPKGFEIKQYESFVLATTDRKVLDFDKFRDLQDGSTIYILRDEHQNLSYATEEVINFTPHYDTLICSGMYEYHASEGKLPIPYTLAELIDNSLSATAKNTDERTIEIRMIFDESIGKPAVIVLDNGCGMTSQQLRDWAVFRLSKFKRENSTFGSEREGYVRPDHVPRSLNSDISFFGVGGKQAVFYIGDSVRMITKPFSSPDVHELVLSKEEFERKEKSNKDVFSGTIKNRKRGDFSHVTKSDEYFLRALIKEELTKQSFTAVVITGVLPDHITFIKQEFDELTRELAHIYHYYIHGVNGKDMRDGSARSDQHPKIDIQITLREKSPRVPRVVNLVEVDNDMQTLYINSAVDTFEFTATTGGPVGGTVEGILRYHPFLYDKETYPQDPQAQAAQALPDDDDFGNESGLLNQARGKRPIFECYWNGRLIPNTPVSEFEWCSSPIKGSNLPVECYSRFSGVLFTDDRFKVTTNKLTFTDLELRLRNKDTIFTLVGSGQRPSKRANIKTEFTQWLQKCHKKFDKQVKFLGYKETITREDVPTKKLQHPWATFSSIEWGTKKYTAGQVVKSQKTQPIVYGTVVRFLLHGDHTEDVFATGGQVELIREPRGLYNMNKIIPISKIDRMATDEAIKKNIDNDLEKLPEKLKVDWPKGNPLSKDAVCDAGTILGPLKIDIVNKKEESLSKMPAVGHKLSVKQKVVYHGPKGDKVVATYVAQHSSQWGFWFKEMGLVGLGKYTLTLNTLISDNENNNGTTFGGRPLPSYVHKLTIKEGNAESFVVNMASSTLRVGKPFDIPLQITDRYDHKTTPPPDLQPEIKCSGLDLSCKTVDRSGTTITIRGVRAKGKILNDLQSKKQSYELAVTLPGLKTDTQKIKISLLPGNPHSIHVKPDSPVEIENGNPVKFVVEIHDEAGNITANPKQIVHCKVPGLQLAVTDCSRTGAGQLVTMPINLKIVRGEPQELKVQFELKNQKNVSATRQLRVLPSTRVAMMEVCSQGNENLVLRNNEKIEWEAGGLLGNLFFKLYDEAGREVPLTEEIASRIKVNWTRDVNLKNVILGKLPDVQVPTQVQEERFYQVSYQDQSVSVFFTIVPRPNEPKRLKATLPQTTVKLGETLSGDIKLELVDQYDNVTKTLTSTCVKQLKVEAEGLDKSAITFTWQESSSSVAVAGVRFQARSLGPREMCFSYCDYVERVTVKVTAGVPAQLTLLSGPAQPLLVLNDRGISTPFVVQVWDEWGNPCTDPSVVVELKSTGPAVKVETVTPQNVDAEGRASFTVTSVSGPKGDYQLGFRGSFNKKLINGPSMNLTVIPDSSKPVSLLVGYDTGASFTAGGVFPAFSVTVVSEEGSPITTFSPGVVSMHVWKAVGATSGGTPPQTASHLRCSKPLENEKKDRFYFRDKKIPECVGQHTVQFSLRIDEAKVLHSKQINVNVVADRPVKLGPDSQPPTPVVSHSKDITSRTLLENITLRIMDSHGNPAGQNLNGKVVISIKSSGGGRDQNLPLFEGRAENIQIKLEKGSAHITKLAIMENSPGEHDSSYILLFKPEVSTAAMDLAPFELPFHFSNDTGNHQKISELMKKKDELTTTVKKYEERFSTASELLNLLTSNLLSTTETEDKLRTKLIDMNIEIGENVSFTHINMVLADKTAESERLLRSSRRVCSIPDNFRGQPDVVGMVGHLAHVEDDAVARVISWFIRGDMDCVITRNTAAAKRIYDNTQGRQQVMPLDTVFVSPGNRSLPHIRNGRVLFDPPGHPVFARELLIFPREQEICETVFKTLLADTIVIDDLDSANSYRKAVVQNKTRCPTILTRQGDKVSANGKFGGAQNKAPPIQELKVFAAPLPELYHKLEKQIELLKRHREALKKKEDAEKERNEHLATIRSPENVKMKQKMEEKKKQLEEINSQLVSTPVRPSKRSLEGAGETSGIITKRTK